MPYMVNVNFVTRLFLVVIFTILIKFIASCDWTSSQNGTVQQNSQTVSAFWDTVLIFINS